MRKKRIIWSNKNINAEDFDYEDKSLTDDEKYERACEDTNSWLDDERVNLDIQLNGNILCIASMGLWNGRKQGYKLIESGNIKDILYSESDYVEWYSDGYNIKSTQSHHDGTNYVEYREIKPNVDIDILLNDIYMGKDISRARLNYYTKSILAEVANVYGW